MRQVSADVVVGILPDLNPICTPFTAKTSGYHQVIAARIEVVIQLKRDRELRGDVSAGAGMEADAGIVPDLILSHIGAVDIQSGVVGIVEGFDRAFNS